jgi:ATP-dependent DNA helicase RecG
VADRQLTIFDLLERPSLDALLGTDQIFESNDYTLFARLTEDDRFDRKSSKIAPNALAVDLSAFGNGPSIHGGVLAIGIDNKTCAIEGCKSLSDEALQGLQRAGIDRCPTGKFVPRKVACKNSRGEDDFLILIRVYYVEDRLVELTDGTAYARREIPAAFSKTTKKPRYVSTKASVHSSLNRAG